MKVAMVDPSLFTGRYDDSLCAALAAQGAAVTLLGRPMRATDAIEPQGYRYRPRFFRWSERARGLLGEGAAFRIAKAAEYGATCLAGSLRGMADADVAHFQWLPLAPADKHLLRRLSGRTRLVHTVHNADAYHADAGVQGRGYAALLDRFDALIVHGDTTREALLARGVDEARLHVVPHPPMRLARAAAADMEAAPDPLAPRLLFFGTMRPYKGVDLLVAACIDLWRRGHRFELMLAGKPFMDVAPIIASVEAAGFGHNLLTDFGFLREQRLDAHIRKADLLAFPYRHIDSSGAFLSALHYGKAMVTSDAGMFAALPEGVAARVPAGNAPALAEAMLPMIESPAIRLAVGASARLYGEALSNWKDTALKTMTVYRSILGR
ncbi:glycosyltransferase involved in cell wall biosynthesis [Sphingobium fontiphilum]|uniref:Glycosyltransferase involved in cell wall biosynthesis n=1 Tax=Sphingobium fontiphilum TaxID=944425 RepID=A0A7W6DHS5_9SPHN|nr:glycosyltransferase family 4 protein [Sphingobium fontiphilum]MBB3980850.1 glycosyltransferase involved in cell wall biosynthesis [Sphingobium fontiphilum]